MQDFNYLTDNNVIGYHVHCPQGLRPIMKRSEVLPTPNIENVPAELLVNTLSCEDVRMYTFANKNLNSPQYCWDSYVDLFRNNERDWKAALQQPKDCLWSSELTSTNPHLSTFEMLSVREYERKVMHVTNEIQQECVCVVNSTYSKIVEHDKESNQNNKRVNVHAPCFFPRSQTFLNECTKPYVKNAVVPYSVEKNDCCKENHLGKPYFSKEEIALLNKTLLGLETETTLSSSINKFQSNEIKICYQEKQVKEKYILQSLFQKVLCYMKQIYPFLTREKKLALVQLANQNNTTVFDQLKWFGYRCILSVEEKDEDTECSLFEEKMKSSLAMDLLDNSVVCCRIIQSCNMNFLNSNRARMEYTRSFSNNCNYGH
ncbi:uncharacterized protein LOC108736553 [Agrilus planipennis]|uniref:Uncharacterized protein LOC108736553 n=1 Tax=Agrilus planipennis TaxID=224129 RepID=A0A1W4WWS8_AGRPL|nr:uncharacterized protein LOC108736553 [Agrilus planipennis]